MKKLGRNSPCHCGSGKKFKRCHGASEHVEVQQAASRMGHEAREFQRREQQGLGKPIISTQLDEHRFVVVGDRLHAAKNWKTFHDFLHDYPRIVLGDDWWQSEIHKPIDTQHRIVAWLTRACEQATADKTFRDKVEIPSTGALSAYMHFAYDLYALKHSAQVESLLIARIKSTDGFPGATHEVRVAASLLRAGFTLELEDETDRRSTHVEFVATHVATGVKYSVEAKRREGVRLKINKLLYNALNKKAEHPRIVFIDTNDRRLEHHQREQLPIPLAETRALLKRYAEDPIGRTLPPAYVIAMHSPEEHHLNMVNVPLSLLLLGFRVDDLQSGYKTLLEQVEIRRRHLPVFELVESMSEHLRIPVSFDGEADVFAIQPPVDKLQIGSRFVVPGPEGVEVEALLESGVVMLEQQQAWCTFLAINGARFICSIALTEVELEAYKQHPSTFFGVIDHNAGRKPLKTPVDYFNFFWVAASETPKAKLLEWMEAAPDLGDLSALSQKELATHYCARMAEFMMATASG
ncbi:SEC-C domain-containing protein [Pseudomonas chlororaphis subsp. aurantiaca]|uniref:YecA family protein n=1 Tax=Pseudomonas chlororaphis TaxID=587753 RepID=UPI0027DE3222|nr:SEC-C domain-containing protein [Pseudomonas chlororaphis]WMJ02019.1 SEC-C domain-containing protein [Pseudomonas chlororaphis subsp. aurantiaca]